MRGRYANYAYHLYDRPDVHMHVTDGRSFIRNSKQQYDVVQMTLVDTWASTAAGAFALSENSLYTIEAFEEYFDHLNPEGMIAITRWEFQQPREALRVVSVAMEALHRRGVQDSSRNFIVVSAGDLDEDGIPVVVLAKKSAFTRKEEESVKTHLASNPTLVPQYLPSEPQDNPFTQLIKGNDPYKFAKQYAYNVAPVDDDAPFFFFTLKLGQVLHPESMGIDWKVNLGVAVLLAVLVISLIAVLTFLILPLALRGNGHNHGLGSAAVLCGHWLGIHFGRDYFYSTLRLVSRTSYLRVNRRRVSAIAFKRGRKHGFTQVAAQYCPRVAAAVRHRCCPAYLCIHPSPCAERTSGIAIHGKAPGERYVASACGIHHGNALSNWPAGARSFFGGH